MKAPTGSLVGFPLRPGRAANAWNDFFEQHGQSGEQLLPAIVGVYLDFFSVESIGFNMFQ